MWYKFSKSLNDRYKNKIFHGGLRDNFDSIDRYGVEPKVGDFIQDVYGCEVDEDEIDNDLNNASYWATWDELSKAFGAMEHHIGQKLGLPHNADITPEHVAQHGLLAITNPTSDFYRQPPYGEGWGEPKQYKEEERAFTGWPFYRYDDYGGEIPGCPFGVEPGDVFTTDYVEPEKIYTGKKLRRLYNKFRQYNEDLKRRQEMVQRSRNYRPKDELNNI